MLQQNKTYQKVLLALADGMFHSGELLGKQLGLTRSAIWKAVAQLKRLGINVQSITRKGYRIQGGITLLNQECITQQISAKNQKLLDDIILLEQVNSTNTFLLEHIKHKPHKNIACFAEYQSHARGRRGHSWLSPFGNNIYHSLLWHFNKDPGQITGLSLAVSIAVIRSLIRYGLNQNTLQLKWPNDICHNHKKLAGVLIEMQAESNGHCSVVIGIGLNTHMDHVQSEILNNQCTSINNITQQAVDRNKIAGYLLDELINLLVEYNQHGLKHFLDEWRQYDSYSGHPIKLLMTSKTIEGTMQGVTDNGEVVIKDTQGQLKQYCNGEVSLRLAKEEASA
ncbi:MAG: bifunctional biotin--[acetyl-CoA-carboxylase] ligase/biotin operon repressor BirA [Gammaproteobacteria bacterium]|nr:bifunctional biotin--[acetyl-CoA-carboxylase] ligase/biotin operon repressor BirA [Gammaproteobacteria bacterium]